MPAPVIAHLATAKRVGFIVPSSNTAVETLTLSILQSLQANIIPLFTRLQVLTLSADAETTSQFTSEKLITAAQLLADAGADHIIWNGTSGMFTGGTLADDRRLAEDMTKAVGVPCSTNTIATIEALEVLGIRDVSIAVPYTDEVTSKVQAFFEKGGFHVHAAVAQKPTPRNNLEIARCSEKDIKAVVRKSLVPDKTKAVLIACTNYPGTAYAADLELEQEQAGNEIRVLDSIAVSAWYALREVGIKQTNNSLEVWGHLLNSL
ncbi:uncharacterized protein MYCFIDRAFT_213282 [Pseudocercospora fijiensis CIRAD86]|uniref:Asp/Glu racemase n=1 Tax=Pseudocercospora fijiensis (strain CIRAD86) TaxID=383855 RepID=N1QB94_PSEFD|nr:uncharacterized protein MYCFIDRAFT_213282 [Pseudocercospora fijiensis CIRAD86]EME88412.1 hypothetical protein MYCFIDRAFT_213282 [Pseudocercospora fijiensis CIRAD86]